MTFSSGASMTASPITLGRLEWSSQGVDLRFSLWYQREKNKSPQVEIDGSFPGLRRLPPRRRNGSHRLELFHRRWHGAPYILLPQVLTENRRLVRALSIGTSH